MEINIVKINDHLYLLDEFSESTGYLLIGNDKACLIDTMNGKCRLDEVVRGLTDKPVVVVNTHGHPDHIGGNAYFGKAYIHPVDRAMACMFEKEEYFASFFKENNLVPPVYEDIKEGDVIDLGGRTLKVYDMPGHTRGGILLLCPEDRALFVGDSINHHLWMQLFDSLSLAETAANMERLLFLTGEADMLLHGHARQAEDTDLLNDNLRAIKEILDGHTEKDMPYNWFGGVDLQHPFDVDRSKNYGQYENNVICYRADNVRAKYRFRYVRPEELDIVSEIEAICFPPNEACTREHFEGRLAVATEVFLVAEDIKTGKMAGFINGIATNEPDFRDEFFTDESLHRPDGKHIMVLGLDVLPEYRMQGLARELVKRYVDDAAVCGRETIVLTCLPHLVAMYQKFGFEDLGFGRSEWGGERWHDMVYRIAK